MSFFYLDDTRGKPFLKGALEQLDKVQRFRDIPFEVLDTMGDFGYFVNTLEGERVSRLCGQYGLCIDMLDDSIHYLKAL